MRECHVASVRFEQHFNVAPNTLRNETRTFARHRHRHVPSTTQQHCFTLYCRRKNYTLDGAPIAPPAGANRMRWWQHPILSFCNLSCVWRIFCIGSPQRRESRTRARTEGRRTSTVTEADAGRHDARDTLRWRGVSSLSLYIPA